MHKTKFYFWALGGAFCLTGCAPREERQVIVQQEPTPQVIEKKTTVVKPVPQNKTIVVQPTPGKVQSKTNVNVNVETPRASSTPLAPAPRVTAAPRPKTTTRPQTVTTPRPTPVTVARPRPTATPARSASQNAPLIVRAQIVSVSKVPDPKTVAYKDSIVFLKYKVLTVQSGTYNEKEILVAHWAMKNKKLLPAAHYRVGQTQTLHLEPLEKHPELESLQRSDDTEEIELEPYWAREVS